MIKLFALIYILIFQYCESISFKSTADPNFSAPITNVTVPVGREATLTCAVHDLVPYKVAWLRVETQTILTIQHHVITKNHRIGTANTENRMWHLHIKDVREADQGWYMCQINTDPMKSQLGYLDVVVPPDIVDYDTSRDMIIDEGQNVNLTCSAVGLPEPTIEWRREGKKPLMSNGNNAIFTIKNSTLMLRQTNRNHMGAYLCIASNGIPPSVSKRITLIVNFPPTVWTLQDIVYASYGQKVFLECISEAYPNTVNYWLHDSDYVQGGKYETVMVDNVYKVITKLIIIPTTPSDFGAYKCVAKNSIGQAEKFIYLYHKLVASTPEAHFPTSESANFSSGVGPMNATVAPIFCKTGLMLVTAVFSAIILRATFGC